MDQLHPYVNGIGVRAGAPRPPPASRPAAPRHASPAGRFWLEWLIPLAPVAL